MRDISMYPRGSHELSLIGIELPWWSCGRIRSALVSFVTASPLKPSVLIENNPKHFRRTLPIHTIASAPPVQRVGQALPEVTGIALEWGSE